MKQKDLENRIADLDEQLARSREMTKLIKERLYKARTALRHAQAAVARDPLVYGVVTEELLRIEVVLEQTKND